VQCGHCEAHCPQQIPIREKLQEAKKELESPLFRAVAKAAKLVMKY